MGREFELKYAATEADLEILKERFPGLRPIAMETTYYDNEAGDFSRLKWTFRRRTENGKSICTLKTPTDTWGRAEFEVEYDDIMASVPLLRQAGAPAQLLLLTDVGLVPSCGARFTRLAGLMEFPEFTAELALDSGVLLGGGRELPFAEVELELKEGSEEALTAFANDFAAKLGLKPEPKSKVARARQVAADNS